METPYIQHLGPRKEKNQHHSFRQKKRRIVTSISIRAGDDIETKKKMKKMGRLPAAILICVIFFPFSLRLPTSTSVVVKVPRFGDPEGRGHREIVCNNGFKE